MHARPATVPVAPPRAALRTRLAGQAMYPILRCRGLPDAMGRSASMATILRDRGTGWQGLAASTAQPRSRSSATRPQQADDGRYIGFLLQRRQPLDSLHSVGFGEKGPRIAPACPE